MIKKIFILITSLLCLFNLKAQEESNVKLKIETGFLPISNSDRLGVFLNLEPKLKSSKNTVIGLRIGATLNTQKIENNNYFEFNIDDKSDNGVLSFVPTFDYYWSQNKLRPYFGIGVGYYFLAAYIDASRIIIADPSEDIFEISINQQVGFLFRGGLELKQMTIGLEYNLVPTKDIIIPNGQAIGTVDESYFGLSVGIAIGVKKSAK